MVLFAVCLLLFAVFLLQVVVCLLQVVVVKLVLCFVPIAAFVVATVETAVGQDGSWFSQATGHTVSSTLHIALESLVDLQYPKKNHIYRIHDWVEITYTNN